MSSQPSSSQEQAAIALGLGANVPDEGDDASHLCHRSTCSRVGHVIWESPQLNQDRKGCAVWVECPHADCDLRVWACVHEPKCIKMVAGATEAEVLAAPELYFH
uniref:Zf-His_Me_endon domain-containing protein n=1 Tax=Globodera pallida TaxID=36090 RepID=A0A183BPM1_GLOPA